jgi:hypothetical protein
MKGRIVADPGMRPSVYVETTIPSYLVARGSRDLIVAAHQRVTQDWWDNRRSAFRLFISQLVLDEAARGDAEMASRRLAILAPLKVLAIDDSVLRLADAIVSAGLIPRGRGADAVHVGVAAVNELDFLMTWNCTHINNAEITEDVAAVCLKEGFRCPVFCTPEELMGGET